MEEQIWEDDWLHTTGLITTTYNHNYDIDIKYYNTWYKRETYINNNLYLFKEEYDIKED